MLMRFNHVIGPEHGPIGFRHGRIKGARERQQQHKYELVVVALVEADAHLIDGDHQEVAQRPDQIPEQHDRLLDLGVLALAQEQLCDVHEEDALGYDQKQVLVQHGRPTDQDGAHLLGEA